MQFKHPEILFALFLLIIPIIVHLFQLRRFKKEYFTNVKFLKEVELQTRKSSNLKKLLILFTRLLLFASLIFSFSQPYISNSKENIPETTYIYLDNSFSMQAKGQDGELFKRATQDIIKNTSMMPSINLYTNNEVFNDLSSKNLKNTLLSLDYHPVKTDIQSTLLKIKSSIKDKTKPNNIFLISDFQSINLTRNVNVDSVNNFYIAKLQPLSVSNVSIDSVYISSQDNESINLKTNIKRFGRALDNMSVSLYNDKILSGKSTIEFTDSIDYEIDFIIPNRESFNGKLQLEDGQLNFDNELYFTINKPKKINIISIGEKNDYMSKIYTADEFNFEGTTLRNFDYNKIDDLHLLILNELENIPNVLANSVNNFLINGGNLVIIPPLNLDFNSYKEVLKILNIGSITNFNNSELAITSINFSHPLLKGVFEKQIKNFQYPNVQSRYILNFRNSSSILRFENNKDFISQIPVNKGKIYFFSSSLDTENSNFKNSPLIVPIFYNFGIYSHKPTQLYYTIGKRNIVEIPVQVEKDEVVHLISKDENFIPQQQLSTKKITLTTETDPLKSGFIDVIYRNQPIQTIAYNYDRSESNLTYTDMKEYFNNAPNITYLNSVNEAFQTMTDKYKTSNLWQLFILLGLLFLIIEIVLLKFLNP